MTETTLRSPNHCHTRAGIGVDDRSAISAQQERLWVLHQLEHARTVFNVALCVRLRGRLDRSVLQTSLQAVLTRHEVMNSCFIDRNGSVGRISIPRGQDVLSFIDLTPLAGPDREDRLQRFIALEQNTAFDLEVCPAIRIRLFRLGRQDHVLLVIAHQIVSDSLSLEFLLEELAATYNAQLEGSRQNSGHESAREYWDYVRWQHQYLSGENSVEDLRFWTQQVEGMAGVELTTDFSRPREASFRGEQESITLGGPLASALGSLAQREQVPLRVVLLSGFVALLSRYTGLSEIVLGTETPGRILDGTARSIGPFTNDLLLRVEISGNPSISELIRRAAQVWAKAEAHQAFPFAKLIESTRVQRDLSRNPLFQVKFVEDMECPLPRFAGLDLSRINFATRKEMLDLSLHLSGAADTLTLRFSYNSDLFSGNTIHRLSGHLEQLLRSASENPEQGIFDLVMLKSDEQQQLVVDWNRTAAEYPSLCLHQLFENQARSTPNKTAIEFGNRSWTYAQLNAYSNQLARYLLERGVRPGLPIGIYIERSLEMLVACLGVLKAGAAYVPLDPDYPSDRIAFIQEDAQIRFVLTQEGLHRRFPSTKAELICLDTDWTEILTQEQTDPAPAVRSNDVAYTLYTSGSTGRPKGVQVEHRNLANFLTTMRREPGLSPEDVLLAVTTLSFDIAGLELYLPLTVGAKVVIASRAEASDAHVLEELLHASGATIMQATPATWRLLIENGWQGNPRLKALCGGEALPKELALELLPRCRELWNMYGPTETTIWSSVYPVTDVEWSLAPIGRPIGNTQMYVVDSHGQLLPVGVPGELWIGGHGVARGYWNRSELTAEKFLPNPFSKVSGARIYRTGDLVRCLTDGNIQYLGRIDNQVKIRGFRIELGEIESILTQHPAVRQAVIAVREDSSGEKQLVAYLNQQATVNVTEIRSFLKQQLPEYMLPSRWVTLEKFPLTPNGKVDRKALPAPSRETSSVREPAADELESKLASIFEAVLEVHPVGVTDDFFDLGGHSVMAARLMAEIRNLTGRQLSLSTLFQGATVRHLRNVLREEPVQEDESLVTEIQAGTSAPFPFFAVVSPGESGLGYAILARHMGSDQAFYQLQARGPIATDRPYSWNEMQDLADQYVTAMRSQQPRGPYYFGGMCDGAHLAIRMAQKLEQSGESVGMLAIFDTWVLENSQRRILWKVSYYGQRLRHIRQLSRAEQFQIATRTVGRLWKKLRGQRERGAWSQAYWPQRDYVPPRFNGRVTLFRNHKQPYYYKRDPLMGWGDRACGGVDAHVLPIDHNNILREPSVHVLANSLLECLEKAWLQDPGGGQEAGEFESYPTSSAQQAC